MVNQIWPLTRLQALFGGRYQSSRIFVKSDKRVHLTFTLYCTTALLFTLFIGVQAVDEAAFQAVLNQNILLL